MADSILRATEIKIFIFTMSLYRVSSPADRLTKHFMV